MGEDNDTKSILGLPQNIVALLAYALPIISGLVIYILVCISERDSTRDNKFLKFHALQAIIFFAFMLLAGWLVSYIPILGNSLPRSLNIATTMACVYLGFTAYKEQQFRLPIIGDAVWSYVNK